MIQPRIHLPLALVAVTLGISGGSSALASEIQFSSLPGNNTSFGTASEYRDNWNTIRSANPTAPAGYGSAPVSVWDPAVQNVSNQGLVPAGVSGPLAYRYQLILTVDAGDAANLYDIELAPDFGFGGAAFVDGTETAFSNADLWWGGSWGSPSSLLSWQTSFTEGVHTIDVYGQEGCCDGSTAGRYSSDGGRTWAAFGSTDRFSPVRSVSDRSPSYLLIALGVAGLATARRKFRV